MKYLDVRLDDNTTMVCTWILHVYLLYVCVQAYIYISNGSLKQLHTDLSTWIIEITYVLATIEYFQIWNSEKSQT